MPKVSIITPIYCDVEDKVIWLDEMIQSVRTQTLADWELILIDDGPALPLKSILNSVKSKYADDKRLRWLENAQNFGPAMTRNTAVALAQSDCILPLDSDDMLANPEVLEFMYDAWMVDQTKTIYGNIQIYRRNESGEFERIKTRQLAQYSFEGTMHLEWGIMPVTTMHSTGAHYAAGGWKPELTHGREDLEYWIACGKAGYCGQKINHMTLLYRKHQKSRDFQLKFENKQLEAMQWKIKELHNDVYKGVYPMACCGGRGKKESTTTSNDPIAISQQAQRAEVRHITTLEGYDEKDLEWVAYQGPKKASPGRVLVRGPAHLPSQYQIQGKGHYFQIHKLHKNIFAQKARLGYRVNVGDPRERVVPEPEPQPKPQVIEVPKPQLSTIKQVDSVAAGTKEVEIVSPAIEMGPNEPRTIEQDFIDEIIIEPNPPDSYSDKMSPVDLQSGKIIVGNQPRADLHISDLGLSPNLTDTLNDAGYTVDKLAGEMPQKLSSLPGIGIKRANLLIDKAKELISKT